MSDEKHTPEPWFVRESGSREFLNDTVYLESADYVEFADIQQGISEFNMSGVDNRANAKRAAACVNACAGVSNSALRPGVVLEMADRLADRLAGNALSMVVLIDAAREAIRLCREMRSAVAEEVLAKALSACEPQ
jgi:hypothetical protein